MPSGELPVIQNPQEWVKLAQRFPVRVWLADPDFDAPLRIGGSATVLVYTGAEHGLNGLADLWIWIASVLNYVY